MFFVPAPRNHVFSAIYVSAPLKMHFPAPLQELFSSLPEHFFFSALAQRIHYFLDMDANLSGQARILFCGSWKMKICCQAMEQIFRWAGKSFISRGEFFFAEPGPKICFVG